MLKKNLLLIMLACTLSLSMFAQGDAKSGFAKNNLIKPLANQAWWGYFNGDVKNVVGIGNGDYSQPGDTYDCAIFIPGDHIMGEGQKIMAIRFYIASALNMSDFKVWVSKKLPSNADLADIEVRNVDMSELSDGATDGLTKTSDPVNDIAFNNPYVIGPEGVFVGYSFKINKILSAQDALPVCISQYPNIADENANFTNMNGAGWKDNKGGDFGNLAIRVLLEGPAKENLAYVRNTFPDVFAVKDSVANLPVDIINMGASGTKKFSYAITFNGVKGEEQEYVLNTTLKGLGTSAKCLLPLNTGGSTGLKDAKVEITKVNGVQNISRANVTEGKVLVLSESVTGKVALEIYTGTWAQFSAKGYVGAARAREIYGDDVVITNIHWGGEDPMSTKEYDNQRGMTCPICNLNRKVKDVDPYFGKTQDFVFGAGDIIEELRAVPTVAKIEAEGIISSDSLKVTANSYTTFLYSDDAENYGIAYVLSTNGLKGEGEEWEQKNIFADFKSDPKTDWLYEPFFLDWIAMDKYITDFEYNDVPVATKGIDNGVSGSVQYPFVEGEKQKFSVEFDLAKIGKKIQNKKELYVNVYIIDKRDGSIVNSDCCKVRGESDTSIDEIDSETSNKIVKRYSVDGTEIRTALPGINIIKYSDGRVVKVLVR